MNEYWKAETAPIIMAFLTYEEWHYDDSKLRHT